MPRKQNSCDAQSESVGYSMRFFPVHENELDAEERRERIQSCLVRMFLRASKRGRPARDSESLDLAA
jgi:hypothetical protein